MTDIEQYEKNKYEFLKQFSQFRPDLYFPADWDDETRALVRKELEPGNIRINMLASIPMQCRGAGCPIKNSCPLYAKNIHPYGNPCPIETHFISQLMNEFIEDMDVDPANLVEVSMVRDLVDQEIQYLRKSKILAQEHFIQENVIGVDPDGKPILKKELHQAVELEDKLHRRKKDLRNQLLATRESRAKAGQPVLETTRHVADIIEEISRRRSDREKELLRASGQDPVDAFIVED